MANYTLQNAYDELEALIDSEYSVEKRKEEILSIIKKLDAKGEFSSNKTVFYDFGTGALGEVERSDPNVRQVGKTDIGKFVFHLTDIEQGTKTELLKDVLQINELSDAHTFINGSYENGMWYTASEKFAKETTGEVWIHTKGNIHEKSILVTAELPALSNNPNITTINNRDAQKVLSDFNTNQRSFLDMLTIESTTRSSVNPHDVFMGKAKLHDALKNNADVSTKTYTDIAKIFPNDSDHLAKLAHYAEKGGNKLGKLGTILGGVLILSAAAQASEDGREEEAKMMLIDYAAELGADVGGGAIVGAIALALIGTATLPAAILVASASMIGSMLGVDIVGDIQHSWWLSELSDEAKIAIFDKHSDFVYTDNGNYKIVTYDATTNKFTFPEGYTYDYLQKEGADGFAQILDLFAKDEKEMPSVYLEGKEYGQVHYIPEKDQYSIEQKIADGDETLLKQILYVRRFGFEGDENTEEYSLDYNDYSQTYIQQKAELFRDHYYGGIFSDAHYVDEDANIDDGIFIQSYVYFGGNKRSDREDGTT